MPIGGEHDVAPRTPAQIEQVRWVNSPPMGKLIDGVVADIYCERRRQLNKWGVQDRPSFNPDTFAATLDRVDAAQLAIIYKGVNDGRGELGEQGIWSDILLEEVYEALELEDGEELEKELIQVAAVAVAWVENLRSRRG